MKNVVIITGPSGCGLSSAEYVFEELGYFVMKNVPSAAIDVIIDKYTKDSDMENICFVCHAIQAKNNVELLRKRKDINLRIVILNCDKNELLKRYTLTRRVHPRTVTQKISATEAIEKDIDSILEIVNLADLYIDTTALTVKQLRAKLYKFIENVDENQMTSVTFISFGIKNGIPQGIDTFFDVRLIPNPYWVEDLKELTGEDEAVIKYMESFPITKEVTDNIINYLTYYLKELQNGGRGSYVIGIACSGGQHRSTYVANLLAKHFSKNYRTQAIHRDFPSLNKE